MSDSSPAVRAAGLKKHFSVQFGLGRKKVLRGLDFEWSRGESYGLVGPNGSGKSTLQRLLAGAERPSAGELTVLGGSLGSSEVRARIGYVPEDSPFPGELTPVAVLDLVGSLQGMPHREVVQRAERLLDLVGLSDHAKKPLRSYSRGMLRRFALAQAWLHEPDLLLLDEPTAGLDAQGFEVLAQLLEEARARGTTIVFASHLMSDLVEHCTEVFVLLDGRFAAQGSPTELFAREGCWRIDAANLNDERASDLGDWIRANGGEVERITPGGKTLFDLYREQREG
jgi:ABC-2 type transport system ATP-binding protein